MLAKKQNIKIAGGGIAGLTAAINLSKAGYDVEVFEKNKDAGGRFYGDLQGLENYTEEENVLSDMEAMGLKINFDCTPLPPLIASTGGAETIHLHPERPICYLVKRGKMSGSLDQGLKQQALDAGVKIYFGKNLAKTEADIIATGPGNKSIFAIDKGIAFRTKMDNISVAILNDEAAYRGYSYLLVVNGYGCMCTVLFDQFKRVGECFEKTKTLIGDLVDLDIQESRRVGGIGSFSDNTFFQKNNQYFVGEAAGYQDLLWGFGIRSAMQSGYIAAQSIIHSKAYEELIHLKMKGKLKASIVNRFLFEKVGTFKNGYSFMLNLSKRSDSPFWFLNRAHQFTYVHALVYPFAKRYMKHRYPALTF